MALVAMRRRPRLTGWRADPTKHRARRLSKRVAKRLYPTCRVRVPLYGDGKAFSISRWGRSTPSLLDKIAPHFTSA